MSSGTQRVSELRSILHAALEAAEYGDLDEMAALVAAALSWLPSTGVRAA